MSETLREAVERLAEEWERIADALLRVLVPQDYESAAIRGCASDLRATLAEHPAMPAEERHPEDYCHRCDGPNISWFTPGAVWDPVMRADGEWKWQEIICPSCFVELAGGGTWHLIPAKDDGERWTGADERAALTAKARAEALREAADAIDSGDADHEELRQAGVNDIATLGWSDGSVIDAHDSGSVWRDWLRARADREASA